MKEATKYLSQECSSNPWFVDRLIISAFIYINHLVVKNNKFLLSFYVDENDQDYLALEGFIKIIENSKKKFDFEDLIELFEYVISPSDRVINGAIYTPSNIREYIVREAFNKVGNHIETIKVADIACGCAGFLYTASKELKRRTGNTYQYIYENQIFGLDIQEYSVNRSKLLLSVLSLMEGEDVEEIKFNIHRGDTLSFKWEETYSDFTGFQVIVGNPPYVCARNLEDDVKENLQLWSVCKSGNPDLYIPFFQIGYESLSPNGILGFITMNSFFKSLNGRALRKYFEDHKVAIRIIDFGTLQVFKSKSTYTCICFLDKVEQNYVEYYKSLNKEFPSHNNEYFRINYDNLNAKNGWNLHYHEIISQIESIGKPFGELYNTRHGIATLRNDLFIFKPVAEDDDFFYLQNGSLYPIEKGICKDILNSNKLSRNVDFAEVVEKVVFPYTDDDKPRALEEKILKERFPFAYNYLKKKKEELAKRDKGKGKYEKWFAFGRTQSLEKVGNKLFFPKYSDQNPNFIVSNDNELLFYNGQAIIGHSEEEMHLIKRIMESRLFWFYIKCSSKPYSSNYYSLNGTYIKNFGIPEFTEAEKEYIISESSQANVDAFLENYYNVAF
jgi:adenine-specific DNA-methyltransferase